MRSHWTEKDIQALKTEAQAFYSDDYVRERAAYLLSHLVKHCKCKSLIKKEEEWERAEEQAMLLDDRLNLLKRARGEESPNTIQDINKFWRVVER